MKGGIGERLMPLFYLVKWENSFVYGRMENVYINMG